MRCTLSGIQWMCHALLTAHAKDAADAAERLMMTPMPQLTHDRECDGCFSSELGGRLN